MSKRMLSTLAVCLLLGSSVEAETRPHNFDFEQRAENPEKPKGWNLLHPDSDVALDTANPQAGNLSLRVRCHRPFGITGACQFLPVAVLAGKSVTCSCFIRTDEVTLGAEIDCAVYGANSQDKSGKIVYTRARLGNPAPCGTTGWGQYQVSFRVDEHASEVKMCLVLHGAGTAWFDSVSVVVDGVALEEAYHATYQPLAAAEREWLLRNTTPLTSLVADKGLGECKWIEEFVGNSRIVALGECSHGTSEFFKIRHRLTKLLASRLGFTILAMEISMPEGLALNEYVLTGKGDPRLVLKEACWSGHYTREFLDLIEWMRAFNLSGQGRLEFWGFDMVHPGTSLARVRRFVEKADPEFLKTLDTTWHRLYRYGRSDRDERALSAALIEMQARTFGEKKQLIDAAQAVLGHLERSREAYLRRAKQDEVDLAIQLARHVTQAVTSLVGNAQPAYRDSCMAANASWILRHSAPGARMIIWAHNTHVGRARGQMGAYLAEQYDKEMRVLACTSHEGRYHAVDSNVGPFKPRAHQMTKSYVGTLEGYLHELGVGTAFIDLRKACKAGALPRWLDKSIEMRRIGAYVLGQEFYSSAVRQEFDGVIFCDRTSLPELLPLPDISEDGRKKQD